MSLRRYRDTKPSGALWLGDIPSNWQVKRLKYLCAVLPSNVDKKTYEGELPVKLCNYTDAYYNEEITADLEFMPATATPEQVSRFALRSGDSIVTKDSETSDDIAVASYVPKDLPGVVCGYHLAIVRPEGPIDGRYVKRLFDSRYLKSRFDVAANGLTRVGLSQYAFDNVEIPLPPREEQKQIVAFLEQETHRIDELVSEQERLIELLKEKRQAVISHAVTRGLNPDAPMRPSHVPWLGDVPAHWQVRALRTLANVVRGASPRPAGDPRFFHGDYIPWVTVGEITKDEHFPLDSTSEFLTAEGCQRSRVFRADTVIYSNSGATLGVPRILQMDACANDGVVGFERLSDALTSSFLCHFLSALTQNVREMLKQGSGQPNLNTDIVKGFQVALPPLSEQRKIATELDRMAVSTQKLVEEATRAIALLRERRSAIISSAVTGQIDVREREAAEVA